MKKTNINRNVAITAALVAVIIFFVAGLGFYPFGEVRTKQAKVPKSAASAVNQAATALSAVDSVVGSGKEVTATSVVTFKYVGKFIDGKIFDASDLHGGPLTADLRGAGLIKGFVEGIVGMKVGGRRQITIPPELGYGSQDIKDQNGNVVISGNSTLIFDIEVVDVK